MDWLMPVALSAVLIALIFLMIALGWRSRKARQSDVGNLPAMPEDPGPQRYSAEGQYVVTTTARDWLDRIAVHGLGVKSNAVATVHTKGIHFDRTGAPNLFIPADLIEGIRYERGMAGKFVEQDGLIVVTWTLGATSLDTGFRTRRVADRDALRDAVSAILPGAP